MHTAKAAAVTVVLASALVACSSAPGTGATPPKPTATAWTLPPQPPGADWARARWRPYDSLWQGLTMLLPEDPGWSVEDRKEGWLVATHAKAATRIAVRWIATAGLANRPRCEARATELGGLPDRTNAIVLERRRVGLPTDFDTVLEVGLLSAEPGKPITGYAVAVGAWVKRCFVYVLTTTASGRGADEAVAERLALFVERSFVKLAFESDLTPAVPRERPPLGSDPR